jgi:hypothetical protein
MCCRRRGLTMARARYQGIAGDRVQLRSGVTGVVHKLQGKRGPYFKVLLVTGEWVWPNDVIAESSGAYLASCGECGIEFRTAAPNSHTCPNCVDRERQSQRPDREMTGSATFARLGPARRFTPAPVTAEATDEQRASVDRWRVNDDSDSPF